MFSLDAWAAGEFSASDLASGNATKGFSGRIGAVTGEVRLELDTELPIEPLAYVLAPDGTLSAVHDTVRRISGADRSTYEVPIFNPASNVTQASRLRLINPNDAAVSVTISGRDDTGAAATGGEVRLTLPAGGARTLTAQQLEAGDASIEGRLGAGVGRWRLGVSAHRPIRSDYRDAMQHAIVDLQSWYRRQTGGLTFSLYDVTLEMCPLSEPSAHYHHDAWRKVVEGVQHCAPVARGTSDYAWVVYADVEIQCNLPGTLGGAVQGLTILGRGSLEGLIGNRMIHYGPCGDGPYFSRLGRYTGGLGHWRLQPMEFHGQRWQFRDSPPGKSGRIGKHVPAGG